MNGKYVNTKPITTAGENPLAYTTPLIGHKKLNPMLFKTSLTIEFSERIFAIALFLNNELDHIGIMVNTRMINLLEKLLLATI